MTDPSTGGEQWRVQCRRTDRMEGHPPHGGCSGFGMHARGAEPARVAPGRSALTDEEFAGVAQGFGDPVGSDDLAPGAEPHPYTIGPDDTCGQPMSGSGLCGERYLAAVHDVPGRVRAAEPHLFVPAPHPYIPMFAHPGVCGVQPAGAGLPAGLAVCGRPPQDALHQDPGWTFAKIQHRYVPGGVRDGCVHRMSDGVICSAERAAPIHQVAVAGGPNAALLVEVFGLGAGQVLLQTRSIGAVELTVAEQIRTLRAAADALEASDV